MALDLSLSNDEERALAKLLRRAIDDDDRFPLSPRVQMWQAILDKIEPPPPLREPLPPPREHVADAAGEIANRGHHKNDRHESDALKSPAPRISWRVSGERLGMAPPFFLLTPVIQDVITSKIGRGVVWKSYLAAVFEDNWRAASYLRGRARPVRFRGRKIKASVLSWSLRNSWTCRGCDRSWSGFRTALSGNSGTRPAASPARTVAFPFVI